MADYPSIVQAFGTEVRDTDGTSVDRSVSGKPRLRSYYTQVRNQVKVLHDIDDTDMSTLDAHYLADRLNAFTFTFAGDSTPYTCRYLAPPQKRPTIGGRWRVSVSLVVV